MTKTPWMFRSPHRLMMMVTKDISSDLESNLSEDDTDIVQYSEARIKYPTEKLPLGEKLL